MDALTPDERSAVERIKLMPIEDIDRVDRALLLRVINRLAPPPSKEAQEIEQLRAKIDASIRVLSDGLMPPRSRIKDARAILAR